MNRKIRIDNARHNGAALAVFAAALALLVTVQPGLAADKAARAAKADGNDLSGVWWIDAYSPKVKPGVTVVLLNPDADAAYKKTMAGLKDGSITDSARKTCTPGGVPRIMAAPYPFQIVQTPTDVTFKYELNNATRTVIMDKPMPPAAELKPSALGNSYGHWEGDTLVVESMGFTPDTFIDQTGLPHSDKLHVSEFLWKTDGGKELQYVAIVQDPTFQQPWMERFAYRARPDIKIADYRCGAKHRDISAIPGAKDWK